MLNALQRDAGNAAVQRMLASEPTVQREGPAAPGVATKNAVTFFKGKQEIGASLDPIPAKISELEATAVGTFESKPTSESDTGTAKIGTSVGQETSVSAELEKSWDKTVVEAVTGMKPKTTAGTKFTPTGGEVGIEGALEGQYVTFKLGVSFLEYDKGEIKVLPIKPGIEVPIKREISIPSLGVEGTLEVKTTLTLTIEPDVKAIAKWLGETFGPELVAVGAPIAAGAAAAGFLVGTMYLMQDAAERGADAGNAAVAAGQEATSFAESFADVATGGPGKGGARGADGAKAAEDALNKQVGIRTVIIEKNRQHGRETIAREIYQVIAQDIYDQAKAMFREKHKDDVSVGIGDFFGIDDLGSGIGSHLKTIYIVLENKTPGGGPLVLRT